MAATADRPESDPSTVAPVGNPTGTGTNTTATDKILTVVEPIIFKWRRTTHVMLLLITAVLGYIATQTYIDAGLEKSIPLKHPYMQTLQKWTWDFGGGNTVLLSVMQRNGEEIYNENYLKTLSAATDAVFFVDGVDRVRVKSIFTPNTTYIEVVEGGLAGENVIPGDYQPTPEMFAKIKSNVGKASVLGRLVTDNHDGAMVYAELLERDPLTGDKLDYRAVAHQLEEIRGRFMNPQRNEYKLTEVVGKLDAGTVVRVGYKPPDPMLGFNSFESDQRDDKGRATLIDGSKVEIVSATNPDYNPDVSLHIIGFAKVVGDITDAAEIVVGFFILALLMTMFLLWWYAGSFRLAMLPLGASLVAVIWEFGLLRLAGFGLDPFAILVPFLVLSVSVSHGVQYVNSWVGEVERGLSSFDASLETFRRLAIPGTTALITDVAGFATIYLIQIDIIQEMSINAAFGVAAIIITNKMLMPIWLTYVKINDVQSFADKQREKDRRLDQYLWQHMAKIVRPVPALITVLVWAVALAWGLYKYPELQIGDTTAGVPELKPDSRYNKDTAEIVANFAVGTDVLQVIAETHADACIDYNVMEAMDRFTWHMNNTEGVQSSMALVEFAKIANSGFNEGRLSAERLPRQSAALAVATSFVPTTSGMLNADCSAMSAQVFLVDHRAETIAHVVQAVKDFNAENKVTDPTAETIFEIKDQITRWRRSQKVIEEQVELRPDEVLDPKEDKDEIKRRARLMENQRNRQIDVREKLAALVDHEPPAPDSTNYPDDQRYNAEFLGSLASMIQALPEEPDDETKPDESLHQGIEGVNRELRKYDGTRAHNVNFALATGNAGIMAATNEVVEAKEIEVVAYVYLVVLIFMWLSFRSIPAVICVVLPLSIVSVLAYAMMVVLDIGLKVATLPVVALAVGIGVDYGIYVMSTIEEGMKDGMTLEDAMRRTLNKTGKAVVFTGVTLGLSVATWLMSALQFQVDMGMLLVFMFTANMFGAILLLPVLAKYLMPSQGRWG